ncbi:ketopantoate reductase family protein [Bacillus sp. FJAT-49736]|uniref:ketopantoate reductase family protein n=1 Tax=Bacillus sp. FJAT-49736 TaxID=2833582 RepID=UPI001BCA0B94|nr:ketopantoate reductase family protein [Bacillus sp. FJAT-49736]MBS4174652.1 ketopantoate reductase family protein [Bacillus sp. FJAT-49736]
MHTVIFGAGAVGGYFGGKLAKAGYPVTFLVRERRYEQLKKRGLKVFSFHGDFIITPNLAMKSEEIVQPELVILSLKNYHLASALPQLDTLIHNGAKILPLLNGVQHIEFLTNRYGEENILGGLCLIESTLNKDGDIVHTSDMQDIVFGALNGNNSKFHFQVKEMLEQSSVGAALTDNIVREMWNKFIFITTFSGITSATRQPIGVAMNDDITKDLLTDFIQEIYQTAVSLEIPVAKDIVEIITRKIENLPPNMTSSMHRDLEKGQPLELEYLQGYVLEQASKRGKKVPVTRSIYSLLHPYKNGGTLK